MAMNSLITPRRRLLRAGFSVGTLGLLGGFEGDADRGEQLVVMRVDAVEGAGADQRLDHAAVHRALVHPLAEVE